MPNCCCYHEYSLDAVDKQTFVLHIRPEGYTRILLEKVQRLGTVDVGQLSWLTLGKSEWTVSNVRHAQSLSNLMEVLEHRVIIDLSPDVDECYALGPYSVFDANKGRSNAKYGALVNQAKYWGNKDASATILRALKQFVHRHPSLSRIAYIVVPPKVDSAVKNVPLQWATNLSKVLATPLGEMEKIRNTGEQKNLPDDIDEAAILKDISDSLVVKSPMWGADVLVVDDTLGTGITLKAMGKTLKASGANRVYGLCVAKDAKGTKGGISLEKESWE